MENQFSFRVYSDFPLKNLFELYINKKNNFDSSLKQEEIKNIVYSFSSAKELFSFYSNINIDKIISNLKEINNDINNLISHSLQENSKNILQNFFYQSTQEIILSLLKNDLINLLNKINNTIIFDSITTNSNLSDLKSNFDKLTIDIDDNSFDEESIFSTKSTKGKTEEYITPKFVEKKINIKGSNSELNDENPNLCLINKHSGFKVSKFKLNEDLNSINHQKDDYSNLLFLIKSLFNEGKIDELERKKLKKMIIHHQSELYHILHMNLSKEESHKYIKNLLLN